jgi:hypothetical protein
MASVRDCTSPRTVQNFGYGNTKQMAKEEPTVASVLSGIRVFQALTRITGAAIYSVGIVRSHDFRFVISESWLVLRCMIFSSGELKTLVTIPRSSEESCQTKIRHLNQRTLHPPKLPKNSIPCDKPGNVAHYFPTIHFNISLFVSHLQTT